VSITATLTCFEITCLFLEISDSISKLDQTKAHDNKRTAKQLKS